MKRIHAIRLIALAPLAFAAILSAGEAAKKPASNAPAATPGQSGTTPGQTGTMGTGPGAATPAAGTAAPAAANGSMGAATVSSDKITFARPTASIEIMAEPSKVWKKLTSHEGLNAFGVVGDKKRNLEKVGDNVHATIAGDPGNVVVTHVVKEADWRAAFEPDAGNYNCTIRFMLKPQAKNTVLTYADWYSDEKSAMVDQNLEATRKTMTESLARFKGLMEKTSAAGNP